MLIFFAGIVDVIQIGLSACFVGLLPTFLGTPAAFMCEIANHLLEVLMGLTLATIYYLGGVKMNTKKVVTLLLSVFLEQIPFISDAPFWAIDVFFTMLWDQADKKTSELVLNQQTQKVGRLITNPKIRKILTLAAPEAAPFLEAAAKASKTVDGIVPPSK